jgi:hypothetical protein
MALGARTTRLLGSAGAVVYQAASPGECKKSVGKWDRGARLESVIAILSPLAVALARLATGGMHGCVPRWQFMNLKERYASSENYCRIDGQRSERLEQAAW